MFQESNESHAYALGNKIGFLAAILLFLSILYYISSGFHFLGISIQYSEMVLGIVLLYTVYLVIRGALHG